ncbi:alpha/beta hydrolase [Roseovarius sp. TE539]|uniref:alpha/beta hydrolase n=1 Tax=Roseovarius sp. TE539 TaxID=2249812 RepID=UPI0015EF27E7|nr:alpha/beta fold hydrolase [Roseovarius sp. TE539]
MAPFLKIAGSLVALYLAVVGLATMFQGKLLFPRGMVGPGAPLPPKAERLTLGMGSGDELVGVHLPADRPLPEGASLVLGFGGNAWNADDLALHLHSVFPDRDVVAFHYRGYPPSTGRPSARAILKDALDIHDEIIAELNPDRIVAVGLSLGAGPAAHLAWSRPITGLVLVTPFDTLTALAREHYSWLPVGLLLRHRMDVAADLRAVTQPVAVIAAEADSIVPPRRTAPVRKAADNLVLDRVIAGAGHNDIYDRAQYRRAMQDALSLIESK